MISLKSIIKIIYVGEAYTGSVKGKSTLMAAERLEKFHDPAFGCNGIITEKKWIVFKIIFNIFEQMQK